MADTSVESIISASLEGMEGRDEDPGDIIESGDSGTSEAAGEASTATAATTSTEGEAAQTKITTKTAAVAAVEDKLAAELGIDPKRNNRIPYDRVQSIVANREKKLLEKISKAFGLDEAASGALKWDDAELDGLFETHHTGKIKKYDEELGGYKTRLTDVEIVEQLMASDPRKFLEALSLQYPQYKEYLGGQTQKIEQQRQDDDAEPPLANPDGTTTVEMLQKHMAWRDRQGEKKFQTELQKLQQRYEPLIERERVREIGRQSDDTTSRILTDARTNWPGFAEDEKEIFKVFTSSKENISIRDAYNEVRIRKMQEALDAAKEEAKTGEKRGRETTLAELQGTKVKSTSVSGGSNDTGGTSTATASSAEDIIRQAIAGLK